MSDVQCSTYLLRLKKLEAFRSIIDGTPCLTDSIQLDIVAQPQLSWVIDTRTTLPTRMCELVQRIEDTKIIGSATESEENMSNQPILSIALQGHALSRTGA